MNHGDTGEIGQIPESASLLGGNRTVSFTDPLARLDQVVLRSNDFGHPSATRFAVQESDRKSSPERGSLYY